jgi:hypothetical protein
MMNAGERSARAQGRPERADAGSRTAANLSRVAACAMLGLAWALPLRAAAQPTPAPTSGPAATAAPAASSTDAAQAVLAQFAAAWAQVTSYTATVTIFERKDAQTQNIVLEYAFHRPSNVTVHVDAGPNAGVTMAWSGGATVVAHRGSGFAALFKRTMSLHDPQATTIRGSSIDELSFGAILAHAQQEAGTLTEAPHADIAGAGVEAVTLMSTDPAADAGLTREIVELSTSTHLPVEVLGYQDATLVRQIDFTKVTVQK